MPRVRLEFTIEPFAEGHPGEHVRAAWRAAEARGAELSNGPFSSETVVALTDADALVADMVRAALAHGAERLSVQVERLDQ